MGPSSDMTGVLIRRETQTHREKATVMTEAEIGVIPPQARECKELGEKHGTEPLSCLRKSQSDFGSLSQ